MDFFQLFNNREIAVGIWCAALLIYLSTKSNPKKLIVSFFSGKVLPFYLIIILYLTTIIIILNVFGFWENVYYKEFIIWFFTVGLVLFFSANKLQESNDFKKIVIRLFSISILWEFIVSQYTFPLTIELVIVPFFGILIALWVKVSHNKEKIEFLKVSKILGNILFLSGFIFSLFVFYNLTQSYKDLLTVSNIKISLTFSLLYSSVFTCSVSNNGLYEI